MDPPIEEEENRETLARFVSFLLQKGDGRKIRALWNELLPPYKTKTIPTIISDDSFFSAYAFGKPLSVADARKIWKALELPIDEAKLWRSPIKVGYNEKAHLYFDVDATPPGLLPKIFASARRKKDPQLLAMIASDFKLVAGIEDNDLRKNLTLALLSFSVAYREIAGLQLQIPHFTQKDRLITVFCHSHLIAEGVRTISVIPDEEHTPIYLCQGTELWPSQPSVLGSILANFAEHGSATEAYAHSFRRIHKHLRDLYHIHHKLPVVSGHSMGGALAMQIALYSHELIEESYAFNPPLPGERDQEFYRSLPANVQAQLKVFANLDDFAFWRIGANMIGNITLYLGKIRWRYYPVTLLDTILVLPAFFKFFLNVQHAFPAHQRIIPFCESYVSFELTQQEIEKETKERLSRFDYLHFFPKLYHPIKNILNLVRRLFGWKLREEYYHNEIEIIALHERDIIDTMTEKNREESDKKLLELRRQKEKLIKEIFKR